jgi:transposase
VRTCTVCRHRDVAAIDAALLEGAPYRDIAGRFHVSKAAVERHRASHLSATLATAKAAAETTRADGLLARLGELLKRAETLDGDAERILRRALRVKDHDTALEAIRTACHTIRERRGALALVLATAQAGIEAEADRRAAAAFEEGLRLALPRYGDDFYSKLLDLWEPWLDPGRLEADGEDKEN